MSSVVYQEVSNNFTNKEQKIMDRDILAVIYSPYTPTAANKLPSRIGEMFIQIAEGTPDRKTRSWISVAGASAGTFLWEELLVNTALPDTVAQTSKSNHFEPTDQTIAGHQIMSFVDGGAQTPEQSKIPAAYNGQFYIAVKTLTGGAKDVAIWVANGNQWLPFIASGPIDITKLAKLDVNNIFEARNTFKEQVFLEQDTNFIGDQTKARQIVGCRVKNGGASPLGDATWTPAMEGEICVYNNTGVTPHERSIWIATEYNTVGTGHWKMIWPTGGGGGGGGNFTPAEFLDQYNDAESAFASSLGTDGKIVLGAAVKDKLARTDQTNVFVPFQEIGGGTNKAFITGARTGAVAPNGVIMPLTYGEIYIREVVGVPTKHEVWVAAQASDTDSWIQVFDDVVMATIISDIRDLQAQDDLIKDSVVAVQAEVDAAEVRIAALEPEVAKIAGLATRMTNLENEDTAIHTLITGLDGDIDRLGITIGQIDADMTTLEGDLATMKLKDDLLEGRITINEGKIATHETRITALEGHKVTHDTRIVELEGHKDTHKNLLDTHSIGLTNLDKMIGDTATSGSLRFDVESNKARITALEAGGGGGGGTGGSSTFVGLSDTPAILISKKMLKVNDAGNALEQTDFGHDDVKAAIEKGNEHAIVIADHEVRIGGVERAPKTFVGLTDTPATITAKKMLKVNNAGNALEETTFGFDDVQANIDIVAEHARAIADHEVRIGGVERAPKTFVGLSDTPTTITAKKMLKVNAAGDALEETTFGFDDVQAGIDKGNEHAIAIAQQEVRIGGLERAPKTFVGLSDTPATLTTKKMLKVNDAGDGLEETTFGFDDLQATIDKGNEHAIAIADHEVRIGANKTSIDGHATRITALENSGPSGSTTFVGLSDTPATLTTKKMLKVNDAGDKLEETAFGHDDVAAGLTTIATHTTEIAALDTRITANKTASDANTAAITAHDTRITANKTASDANTAAITAHDTRITANKTASDANKTTLADHETRITTNKTATDTNGATLLNHKNRIELLENATGKKVDAKHVAQSTMYKETGATGSDIASSAYCVFKPSAALQLTMPTIVAHDVAAVAASEVREGRLTWISNVGTVSIRLNSSAATFVTSSGASSARLDIPAGNVAVVKPLFISSAPRWAIMSVRPISGTTAIRSYVDLTDTPSTVTAKKMMKVNDAGDAFEETAFGHDDIQTGLTQITTNTTGIADHETRIVALEAGGGTGGSTTFVGLTDTPTALTLKKMLKVNDAGNALEETPFTFDTVETAMNYVGGLDDGNSLVNPNVLGCVTSYTSSSVPAETVKNTPFVFVTPNHVSSRSIDLPDVKAYNSTTLDAYSVRAGRTTWISNQGAPNRKITINAKRAANTVTQKLRVNGVDVDSYVLAPGYTAVIQPCMFSGNVPKWVLVGKFLSSNPITTFKDLSDTPATLTTKKMLKVNDAGTALEETSFGHDEVATSITNASTALTNAAAALGTANSVDGAFNSFKNGEFTPLSNSVTAMNTSLTAVETNVATAQNDITDNYNKIAAVEGIIGDFTTPSASSLRGRMNAAETSITDHGTRLGTAETSITDHGTRLGAAETSITDHGTRLTTAEASITDYGTRISGNEVMVSMNAANVTANQTAIAGQETRLAAVEARLATIRAWGLVPNAHL